MMIEAIVGKVKKKKFLLCYITNKCSTETGMPTSLLYSDAQDETRGEFECFTYTVQFCV